MQRSHAVSTETSGEDPGPSSATNDGYEKDLTKLNVKQLRERIKSKNINGVLLCQELQFFLMFHAIHV